MLQDLLAHLLSHCLLKKHVKICAHGESPIKIVEKSLKKSRSTSCFEMNKIGFKSLAITAFAISAHHLIGRPTP